MKKELIPIFFTVDRNYAPWLDVAIRSMVDNASMDYDYKIYVLHQDLTPEDEARITTGVKSPFEIEFVKLEDEFAEITDRKENRLRCDYFTLTIYFRLFIADMYPQYDKGIYIDSDITVPGDISKLYELELGDNIIGACPDFSIHGVPELEKYLVKSIGVKVDEYINSGVLLMNLKMMRDIRFSEQFLYLFNKYHFDCVAPDQDYLNAMCNGRILYLDECWDTMPPLDPNAHTLENPMLIHYNLFQKPWCYDNIAYEEYFWKYAQKSPYYQEIIDFKNNYSDQQKQSDSQCMANLIEKAGAMDETHEITFKRVYEAGENVRILTIDADGFNPSETHRSRFYGLYGSPAR